MDTSAQSVREHLLGALEGRKGPVDALELALFLRGLPQPEVAIAFLRERMDQGPDDPIAGLLLIQLLCWAGRSSEAEGILDELLAHAGDDVKERMMRGIIAAMGADQRHLGSRYIGSSGAGLQNLGFFEHRFAGPAGERVLITKMMLDEQSGNEVLYYTRIAPMFEADERFSPPFIAHVRCHRLPIVLLTMEKVRGEVPDIAGMDDRALDGLVARYAPVAFLPPGRIVPVMTPLPFAFGLSHGYLVQSFQWMHDGACAGRIHAATEEALSQRGYRPVIQEKALAAIDALRRAQIHRHVDPATHYAFLHGDLHRHNLLQQGTTHTALDWTRCALGPRGIDLAVLLRRFGHQRVWRLVERHGIIGAHDRIPRIMFNYALIVVSVMLDLPAIKEEDPDLLFAPASDAILRDLQAS